MISTATFLWTTAGLMAGGVHSLGIRHTSTNFNSWVAATGMLRLVVVGAVLTTSAASGFLFPAMAGWIAGFVATMALFVWRVA